MRTTLCIAIVIATAALSISPGRPPVAPAPGASGVTAESLLARWAEAVGGVERLLAVHATYSRSRLEGNEGAGQAEEWSTSKGQRRQVRQTASGEEVTVFDRSRGWTRTDGQVQPLSPEETRGQLSAAYLAGSCHLVPSRRSGQCKFLGVDGPTGSYLLEITPKGGRATRYYLDPQTFLPVRSERDLAYTSLAIEYHDWREVDGMRVPGRCVITTADSTLTVTESLEEVHFNPRIGVGLFTRPKEGPSGVQFESVEHVARVPIVVRDAHVYFQGTLNDSLVWLTLDTGALSHIVDDEFARALSLPITGQQRLFGAAGSTPSSLGRGLRIGLPGLHIENQSFRTSPLEFMGGVPGLHVKAILGYDLFTRLVVEVDYRGREMRLSDPDRYRYRGTGAALPITLRENHPYVQAEVSLPGGSAVGEFVIDTGGGNTLMLASDFAAAHGLPNSLERKLEGRGHGVGGTMRTVVGRLPGLRVGPFQVMDPVVMFSTGEIAAPGTAGNIGGRFLSRFRVIFDYRRMRMILEPTPGLTVPEEIDMSGLALSAVGPALDSVRVDRVRPESPGDSAGVKPGDVLDRIDGERASDIGVDSVRAMLRLEGRYSLVLRRSDVALPVTIRTRRRL